MRPFEGGDTYTTFRSLVENVIGEVNSLDNEYVLKASPTELEQYFLEKVLVKPLVLHEGERYIKNQDGIQIDVSHDFRRAVLPGQRAVVKGTRVDIAIPFEGDPSLWRIQASTFTIGGYPEIEIEHNEVIFSVSFADDSAEPNALRNEIERLTKSLRDAVGYLKRDVDNHNSAAPNRIKEALARKTKLAQSAIGTVAALVLHYS